MPVNRTAVIGLSGLALAGVVAVPSVWLVTHSSGSGADATTAAASASGVKLGVNGFAKGWRNSALPAAANTTLVGVAAATDGSAFAVGSINSVQLGLYRFSGGAWTRTGVATGVATPAVAAVGAKNAWVGGIGLHGGVTLHWNGSSWKSISVPSGAVPYAMSASSDGGAWLVAGSPDTSTVGSSGLARWNGSGWTTVSLGLPASTSLTAVTALSKSNVWVAGVSSANGTARTPVVLHYNGSKWTKLATPPGSWGTVTAGSAVTGIAADSAGHAFLLRAQNTNSLPNSALIAWNGSSWTQHGTPTLAQPLSIAADGGSGAWVVPSSAAKSSLYFHWTGTQWATLKGPARSANTSIKAIVQIPGTTSLWSAGMSGSAAVAEHYAP